MEELENSDKICVACYKAPAHPNYDGYCEDCFVDKKLVKAYGSRHRDRSIRNNPSGANGIFGNAIIHPDERPESFT